MDVTQTDRITATVQDIFRLNGHGFVLVLSDDHGPIPDRGRVWNGAAFVPYAGPDFIETVSRAAHIGVTVSVQDLGTLAVAQSVEFTAATVG